VVTFAIQASTRMSPELIKSWLQFAQLAAGVVILTAGVVQCLFSKPSRKNGNAALGALGICGVLYGIRLLIGLPEVRALFSASPRFWLYLDTDITYVILVPLLYFFELTFGAGWRDSIRWMRILATTYAVIAVLVDAVTATPTRAKWLNGYLVVAAMILIVWNSARLRAADTAGIRIVRAGVIVFAGFVLYQNVINDRFFRGAWNVEWAGALIMLGCLGYVAVTRAVENDRRLLELRHELDTARQIQASILPHEMPAVDGLGLAARYLPMTAVAGDFYDFLDLGRGCLGVLVADVSGHGIPAALIASMVKVALVAQSAHGDDPARVLTGMNDIFCGRLEHQFVTAAYAYVDADSGRLRYGAAGHPPALLVHRNGEVEEIVENGVMLGHFPGWQYSSVDRPFLPGDRLILYTDGLVEATDASGEFFDGGRLRAFAQRDSFASADAFAGALVEHVSTFGGRTPTRGFDDDVTVVVVDRKGRA
jgi:sigma-B regulation protein RsbU (phosphoserine phosphatase)